MRIIYIYNFCIIVFIISGIALPVDIVNQAYEAKISAKANEAIALESCQSRIKPNQSYGEELDEMLSAMHGSSRCNMEWFLQGDPEFAKTALRNYKLHKKSGYELSVAPETPWWSRRTQEQKRFAYLMVGSVGVAIFSFILDILIRVGRRISTKTKQISTIIEKLSSEIEKEKG